MRVAVVGATGAVGREILKVLEARNFPLSELRLYASPRSAGVRLAFRGEEIPVEPLPEGPLPVDLVLASAGGGISRAKALVWAEGGALVVDNSSAWRMDPNVPLVVSQVNPGALTTHNGIVANPNCSTMQLAPLLKALSDAAGLERVVVATYQAVSGAGAKAVADAGTPAAAGEIRHGARPGLVHHGTVLRTGDVRVPRGHRAARVRQRRARGSSSYSSEGRR